MNPRCLTLVFVWILSGCFKGILSLNCKISEYEQDDKCTPCPITCSRCINNRICTLCLRGFYGKACDIRCSENCNEQTCLQENGQCLSCVRGHYFAGNKSCVVCPGNCIECQSEDKCTSCKVGFMGDACKGQCTNCRQGSGCTLETGVCISACQDGYSGDLCLIPCDSRCKSCERINADRCTVCANGRYGENCEKCPTNCMYGSCNSIDGFCTHGCKEGNWGSLCEFTCPNKCLGGVCLRNGGSCSDGCLGNFTGSKCLCPDKCKCSAEGVCEKCSSQSDYLCDSKCQKTCIENICQRGVPIKCLYGCREGLGGDLCNLELDSDSDPSKPDTLLIVVIAGICVSAVLISIFLIVKCRKRRNIWLHRHQEEELPDTLMPLHQAGEQDHFQLAEIQERHENPERKEIQANPISRQELEELVASKTKEEYQEEFKYILSRSESFFKRPNDGAEGVLNASFISNSRKKMAYIVCKAPTENIMETFSKMIVEEKCAIIVLLSTGFMSQKRDDNTYFPKNDWKHVSEDVQITYRTNIVFDTHCTTDMDIQTPGGDRRVIIFSHFTGGFEGNTEDRAATRLANFLTHVRILETTFPQLVCSSDDISLCGIYVALDMLVEELESTNQVNIVGCVSHLLQQRPGLIQTVEEYEFIHKALVFSHKILPEKKEDTSIV